MGGVARRCCRCGDILETYHEAADHISDCYDVVRDLTVEVDDDA